MGKKSGSGMNNPDHISESLEKLVWRVKLKYLNSLMRIRDGKNSNPGWEKFGPGIPDPQHWLVESISGMIRQI
jgi:hypothetical protein